MIPSSGTLPMVARQPADHDASSLVSSDSTVRSSSVEERSATEAAHPRSPGNAASVMPLSSSSAVAVPSPKLQAMALPAADTTGPRAARLKSVLPFSGVPPKAAKIYTIAADVEYNISVSHDQMRKAIASKPAAKAAHALLKSHCRAPDKRRDEAAVESAYQLMKLGRRGMSSLELCLEKSPDFRHLLFAPTGGVRDTATGLYAELRQIPTGTLPIEYVLLFPGTGAGGAKDAQWKANVAQATGIGGMPKLYMQALGLASEIRRILMDWGATLSVAGHSMGGCIANFVGLALDLDSCCFNAAALGPASLDYLDIHGCLAQERVGRQVHVGFGDDWATHPSLMKGASAMAKLAAGTTGNLKTCLVGQVYHLSPGDPLYPANKDVFERHLLASLGTPIYQSTRNAGIATAAASSTPVANLPTTLPAAESAKAGISGGSDTSGSASDSQGDEQ